MLDLVANSQDWFSRVTAHISCFLIFRKQVIGTKEEAEKDGVKVPLTLQDYCVTVKPKTSEPSQDDFYDDDYDDGMEDDDDDEDAFYVEDDDDSGNEEL